MSHGSFRKSALAGCAAVLLAAAPAAAAGAPCVPDLRVVRQDPDPVRPGGATTVHAVVVNNGNAATTDPFTVTVHVPPGVVAAEPFSPSSCRALPFGHTVTCTFPAGLRPGDTATADIPFTVATGMAPGILTGNVEVALPGDPTPGDDTTPFKIMVL